MSGSERFTKRTLLGCRPNSAANFLTSHDIISSYGYVGVARVLALDHDGYVTISTMTTITALRRQLILDY